MQALCAMNELEAIYKKIESVPDFNCHSITSVNYRNGYGDTPLHIVSTWGDCNAINVLVSAGADINSVGESGFTPLHCAVEQNHIQAIKLLVNLGARQLHNNDNNLPIDLARLTNNIAVVNALINKNI